MLLSNDFQQDEAFLYLQNAYTQKTLSTSYLFSGVRGLGKKELALELGRMVNCLSDSFDIECDCKACHKIKAGIHPDVKIVGEDIDERSIKIKDVREAQNWLHFKPFEGNYKLLIIKESERMTPEAQNAFLKTLEEPPAQSFIILTVSNPLVLLPTILSRVIEVRLKPLSKAAIKKRLSRDFSLEGETDFIAYLSGGSFEKARAVVESGILDERNRILESFCKREMFGYIKSFEASSYRGMQDKLKIVLDIVAFILRDLEVLSRNEAKDVHVLINVDYADQLREIAQTCDNAVLTTALDEIRELKRYIDKNVNVKMIVTSLMVTVGKVMQ